MGGAAVTWDEFEEAFAGAGTTRALDEVDPSIDSYITASEKLANELKSDLEGGERSLDAVPGATQAETTRVQLAGAAAADLEVALRLLDGGARAVADDADRVNVAELRAWDEVSARGFDFGAGADDAPDNPTAAKEVLARRLSDYHAAVADNASTRLGDVGKAITAIGIDKIVAAAGRGAAAIIDELPPTVDRILRRVARLVTMAIEKLRSFLRERFPEVEKKIADWWNEKIGDKELVPRLVRQLLGVNELTQARQSELERTNATTDLYNNAGKELTQLQGRHDSGAKLLASLLSLAAKIWPLLAAKIPGWGILAAAALVAASATFVLARAGDYVDWENIGPLKLPDWVDFVNGPRYVMASL